MPTPHVLITGGSRGIGLAIAHLFARNSYRCTLVSRFEAPLQSAVSALNEKYPLPSSSSPHAYIAGSVSSPSFWSQDGIGKALSSSPSSSRSSSPTPTPANANANNKIDVLVNCAGISQRSLFAKTSPDQIQNIVDTNLTGVMLGTRFLLRNRFFGTGRGEEPGSNNRCIVNVASLLGTHGGYGAVAYAASKAGVLGFTRGLAGELGRGGVRVNAVVPGYVETGMVEDLDHEALSARIPLGRFAKPEEIASAALFLAQNEYAHNCVINLDGGLSAV